MDLKQDQSPHLTRRRFLKALGGMTVGAVAMGLGGWTYATRVEPGWIETVPVELTLPRLSPAFDGFRLAQISDIHLSQAMNGEQLAEACRMVLAFQPDLVAISGDLIEERRNLRKALSDLLDGLRELTEQAQVVFVLGNHDYWTGEVSIREAMKKLRITELRNDVLTLEREGQSLHAAGVDDAWVGKARLRTVLDKLPEDGAAILLAHEPDYADISARSGRFDLQISGHTHGGQVVLPLVGPPILPHYGRRYPAGLYHVGTMMQYTNRGLGTTSPHVRLNCRPEITLFTLRAPAAIEAAQPARRPAPARSS